MMSSRPGSESPAPQAHREAVQRRGLPGPHVRPAWRNSIITIALAGLAAFLGVHLGSRQTHRPPAPLSERVFEVLNENIQLTEQQKKAIRRISEDYAPTRERLRTKSRGLNMRLASLMAQEQGFGPQTAESLEQLQIVMGERLKLSMQYMLDVREVLTPEQKAYFDTKVSEEASLSR